MTSPPRVAADHRNAADCLARQGVSFPRHFDLLVLIGQVDAAAVARSAAGVLQDAKKRHLARAVQGVTSSPKLAPG